MGAALVAHLTKGRLRGHRVRGACRSERLVARQHLPDRLGQAASDVDLGDLRATLLAQPGLVALVAVAVDGVAAGVGGGFHQRPAQVLRAGVSQMPAAIGRSGLVDARAQAGVAAQLRRRGEAVDIADLGGDRVAEDPRDRGAVISRTTYG